MVLYSKMVKQQNQQIQQISLALCPTHVVWINKTNFTDMNVHYLQRVDKEKTHVNKNMYSFHLLPRLTSEQSNSQNKDRAWRPTFPSKICKWRPIFPVKNI